VKSPEGIRFRRWANDVLKRYVIAGVATNESRLRQIAEVASVLERSDDATVAGIAEVLKHYSPALRLLDGYDRGALQAMSGTVPSVRIEYSDARSVVDEVARQFPHDNLLGIERGDSLRGILESVEQTYSGQDLYPSVQEKAAHLLYFVVKDHPLADGNKRSAAALFTYYLSRNGGLRGGNGEELVSSNALTAITLMTAMSKPEEKETMIRLVINMLNAGAEADGPE
jgi:prophage maintenance system killer protein